MPCGFPPRARASPAAREKLGQFADDGRPFFADRVTCDETAIDKYLRVPGMRGLLLALRSRFAELAFDQQSSEILLKSAAESAGLKPAVLIHARAWP